MRETGAGSVRLRSLPTLSGLWAFALVVGSMGAHHLSRHGYSGWASDTAAILYPTLLIGAYAGLMGLLVYFLTASYATVLRQRLTLPVAGPRHALDAVQAAVALQARLGGHRFSGGHRLRTRIGYTVHGDAVNLAQRL